MIMHKMLTKMYKMVTYFMFVSAGHQPLGISSGFIKNNEITVESGNSFMYPPYNARLDLDHSKGGWCVTGSTQTLVVDLGTSHVITKVCLTVFKWGCEKPGGARGGYISYLLLPCISKSKKPITFFLQRKLTRWHLWTIFNT